MTRGLAGIVLLSLAACGGSGASETATSAPADPTAAPSPEQTVTEEPTPSATPEAVAILQPTVTFDVGQEVGLLDENGGLLYAQVASGVVRVDPTNGDVTEVFAGLEPPWGLNIGFGSAWVSTDPPGNGIVHRYDLETGELLASIEVQQLPVESLSAYDSIWVPNDHSGTVSRIDPSTNQVVATIDIVEPPSGGPVHVSAGAGLVWAASPKGNLVAGIDPMTDEVVREITVPDITCGTTSSDRHLFIGKCVGSRLVWVYDPATGERLGEIAAHITTNGERTFALTVEPATRNTLVHAVDPADLSLGDPVALTGIPGYVRFGREMLWTTSGTQILGYAIKTLPVP